MAVLEEPRALKVTIKLNDGSTATGQIKTANVSLGTLNVSRYEANEGNEKAINIINALGPCFERTLYAVVKTRETYLNEE